MQISPKYKRSSKLHSRSLWLIKELAMAEQRLETGEGEYTKDGTVDLKGNPVLRSKRGGWTACSFIVVYEVFERMAYYGISSNLVLYLTKKLHQGTVASANNVTNWVGTIWMTPIIGAYIADAHLGRYWTFMIASAIYISGMCLLTLSVSLPSLKPPACGANTSNPTCSQRASPLQLGIFYLSLYILAIGTGGTKPNISTIGADQFDVSDPKERAHKLSFFNWWLFSIFFGTLFAFTVLVYLQDNVGWTLGYALPTLGLIISVAIFLAGTPFYRHKLPSGSPFTKIARVFVAAYKKWRVSVPSDPKELYELDLANYTKRKQFRMESTTVLRFLNKAAVKTEGPSTPWTLCTVTQVEETKQMLKMLPVLLVSIVPSAMVAQLNTLFVKQGTTLNRHIGPHFQIPPASLQAFVTISMLISLVLYDRFFVPIARRFTKNPRGISLLQRMGVGLVLHIFIMSIASATEHHRLSVAREHSVAETGGKVPLTMFILLPQFLLMGVADAFLDVAKLEFFYDQAPEGMKSLGTSYSMTTIGVGHFVSSFLLSTVSNLTKRNGHKGWILNNLNESHLDYYYAFFVGLNCINLVIFLIVSRFYVYKAEDVEFSNDLSNKIEVVPVASDDS
ncbi:Protein NRT1/ PTR FAMILY 5.3 [Rhynchospora pubera]|uniref:Protein NRT1/ PTR FAMILY 5.3 n=1 Tax=Rhynchospora pubera TaxID=906938 RepID=A0AAV8E241_9POAL|nr:Protein NRT1/ PTR FAMILY 5.3 [Rhynchospora pubera]